MAGRCSVGMSASLIIVLLVICNVYCISATGGESGDGKCLKGPFHKATPSPEGPDFSECHSWRNSSCCNVNLTLSMKRHKYFILQSKKLYTLHWDRCGNLSAACDRFFKDQECFYQCEPRLYHFKKVGGKPGVINAVPVCASHCDAWYAACKDDKTCVKDWLSEFNFTTGENQCPTNSKCVTFSQMYGNSEGICNNMWGSAYIYQKSNQNCMVMKFDPSKPNPNSQVTKISSMAPNMPLLSPLFLWACTILLKLVA